MSDHTEEETILEELPQKEFTLEVSNKETAVAFEDEFDCIVINNLTLTRNGDGPVTLKAKVMLPDDSDESPDPKLVEIMDEVGAFEGEEKEKAVEFMVQQQEEPKFFVEGPGTILIEGFFCNGSELADLLSEEEEEEANE